MVNEFLSDNPLGYCRSDVVDVVVVVVVGDGAVFVVVVGFINVVVHIVFSFAQ